MRKELRLVLKDQLKTGQNLMKSQLEMTNKKIVQTARGAGRLDFLSHSLTGNEYIVAQMAKKKRYQQFKLPGDKVPEETKHRCNFDDCWDSALPLTDYCQCHIADLSNPNIPFIYQFLPKLEDIILEDAGYSDKTDEELREQHAKLYGTIDWSACNRKTGNEAEESSVNTSRASTPHHFFLDGHMSEASKPGTPNGRFSAMVPPKSEINGFSHEGEMHGRVENMEISKSILGEELFNPDQNFNENNAVAPEAGTDVNKPVEKTWTLSESGSSDDDEEPKVKEEYGPIEWEGEKPAFKEGGLGTIIKLDNMQYDVSSDNPLVDPAELAAIEAKKVAMRRPQTSNKNQGLKILPGSSNQTDRGMMIAPNTQQIQLPNGQTAIQIPVSQVQSILGANFSSITSIAGDQKGGQVFQLIQGAQGQNIIQQAQLNSSGQMMIPIQQIQPQQVQMPQPITPMAAKPKARSESSRTHSKTPKQKPQPSVSQRELKLVNVDFFGAQEPRNRKPSGGTVKPVPSALERLAKKAEERSSSSPVQFQGGGSQTYGQLTPRSSGHSTPKISTSGASGSRTNIKLVKSKLSSLESATTVHIPQAQSYESEK